MSRLAYLLLIAALAFVGVAMTAHGAEPPGGATVSTGVAAIQTSVLHHDADPQNACATCEGDHGGAALVACALVALVALFLFVRPRLAAAGWFGEPRVDGASTAVVPTRRLRPPDLLALGISRT